MDEAIKECLVTGLKSKGFRLDFEAKSDIDNGFECDMFSDGKHLVIITGKGIHSEKSDEKEKMYYRQYYCQIGNDQHLKKFLDTEALIKNPSLFTGDYSELLTRLINKVKAYGTKKIELLSRSLNRHTSLGSDVVVNQTPKVQNVIDLSKYRKSRSLAESTIPTRAIQRQQCSHLK